MNGITGSVLLPPDTPPVMVETLQKRFPDVTFSVEKVDDDVLRVYSEEDASEDLPAREVVRIAIAEARAQAEPLVRAWQLYELAYVPPDILPYPLGSLDLKALAEDVNERPDIFQWDPEDVPGDGDPDEIAIVDLAQYGAEAGWRLLGRCAPEGNVAWELSRA